MERSLKKIAFRYMLHGSFLVDFVSIFPFQLMLPGRSFITKLFRLFRLPRLIKLVDVGRFNQLLKSFFENSSRDERIVAQYMMMYVYRIFRLIIIAIIFTYFIGCFWYMASETLNYDSSKEENGTFITNYQLEELSNYEKLVISCYFALTTLSTVGYGDYHPISNLERIIAVFIMLVGVAFFSYNMGSFIEFIQNY